MTAVLGQPRTGSVQVGRAAVTLLRTGMATSIQDLGRTGFAHLGVSPSGPADPRSFTMANRLVGNRDGAAALEVTLGGVELVSNRGRHISVTGAPVPVTVDGATVDPTQLYVRPGSVVRLGAATYGLRTYLAIAGGITVAPVLGSMSQDTLSGLGPERLHDGSVLGLGAPGTPPTVPVELAVSRLPADINQIRMTWGPRDGLFDPADRRLLTRTAWQVSDRTNRVGVRLSGAALTIGAIALPSEGMVRGAIQVPPSGEPIVFLADHPVTGGYPVIGVVRECDLGLLSQARPGSRIHFTPSPVP